MHKKIPSLIALFPLLIVSPSAQAMYGVSSLMFDAVIYAIVIPFVLAYVVFVRVRRDKLLKKAKEDHAQALGIDASWGLGRLEKTTKDVFFAYQKAWTEKDFEPLVGLLHSDYYARAKDDMEMRLADETNVILNPLITSLNLVSVRDVSGKEGDMFVMEVNATKIDYTTSVESGRFLRSPLARKKDESDQEYETRAMHEPASTTQSWVFTRVREAWLLSNIETAEFSNSDPLSDIKTRDLANSDQLSTVNRRDNQALQVNVSAQKSPGQVDD